MAVQAPPPTATWFPLSHGHVIKTVERALIEAGFRVEKARYALARGNHRLFAVLDLASVLASGVSAAPGDVVLLAGKGHEDYQIVGKEKRPFDDVAEARSALVLRRARGRG